MGFDSIFEEVDSEFPMKKPCELKVGAKAALSQLENNAKVLRKYNNLIMLKTPGYGSNRKIPTNFNCLTDNQKDGKKYIYIQSKTTTGVAQSLASQINKIFKNLATQDFIVCCPNNKINDNGECEIDFIESFINSNEDRFNMSINWAKRYLIFIFLILIIFICLRYIY